MVRDVQRFTGCFYNNDDLYRLNFDPFERYFFEVNLKQWKRISAFAFLTPTLLLGAGRCERKPADLVPPLLVEAKKQGKTPLLKFYEDWCSPCHALDKLMDTNVALKVLIDQQFLVLPVDGATPSGKYLFEKFNVTGYPTLIVLNREGKEQGRLYPDGSVDFSNPTALQQRLVFLNGNKDTLQTLLHQWASAPGVQTKELAFAIAKEYIHRKDSENAKKWVEKANTAAAWLALGYELYKVGLKDHPEALNILKKVQNEFSESDEAMEAAKQIAEIYFERKAAPAALKVLEDLIRKHPNRSKPHKLFASFCLKYNIERTKGIQIAEAGLKIEKGNLGLWEILGWLYYETKACTQARKVADYLLSIDPKDHHYHNLKAACEKCILN